MKKITSPRDDIAGHHSCDNPGADDRGQPTRAGTEPSAGGGRPQSRAGGAEDAPATPVFIEAAFARRAGASSQGPRNAWWQTARTPRQGFILGGCYFLLGLAFLSLGLITGLRSWDVATLIYAALCAAQLASAVALYRHEHSAPQASGESKPPES
jgi:hypothetical protein